MVKLICKILGRGWMKRGRGREGMRERRGEREEGRKERRGGGGGDSFGVLHCTDPSKLIRETNRPLGYWNYKHLPYSYAKGGHNPHRINSYSPWSNTRRPSLLRPEPRGGCLVFGYSSAPATPVYGVLTVSGERFAVWAYLMGLPVPTRLYTQTLLILRGGQSESCTRSLAITRLASLSFL